MTAAKKKEEEKILRREEKLDEINKRRAGYGGRGKMARKTPYYLRNQNQFGMLAQQEEAVDRADVYDKINGEKVLREYGSDGLRNAFHLIISQPQ